MSGSSRLILLTAVGLLAALGGAVIVAGRGGVLGGSAESLSGTEQPSTLASEHDNIEAPDKTFELVGVLVRRDGDAVVVTGPSGDVAATVTVSTTIRGDLEAGDTVTVRGALQPDGTLLARQIDLERAVAGDHRSDGTGYQDYESCAC